MGDRVDLWGGLPDRPKPYFSHQRKGTRWDDRRGGVVLDDSPPAHRPLDLPPLEQRRPSRRRAVPRSPAGDPRPRSRRWPSLPTLAVFASAMVFCSGVLVGWTRHQPVPVGRAGGTSEFALRAHGYQDSEGAWHAALAVRGPVSAGAVADLLRRIDGAGLREGDLLVLSSDEGTPDQGMALGREIRRRVLYTAVGSFEPTGAFVPSSCRGPCLLAYLGGVQRFDVRGSTLGLDWIPRTVASVGGRSVREPSAPVELSAYAAAMGVSPVLAALASDAPVGAVRWLSAEEVERLGVSTFRLAGL